MRNTHTSSKILLYEVGGFLEGVRDRTKQLTFWTAWRDSSKSAKHKCTKFGRKSLDKYWNISLSKVKTIWWYLLFLRQIYMPLIGSCSFDSNINLYLILGENNYLTWWNSPNVFQHKKSWWTHFQDKQWATGKTKFRLFFREYNPLNNWKTTLIRQQKSAILC